MDRFVILRTREAGIHCGFITSENLGEQWVKLRDGRRVWRWRGANTLHEMAAKGLSEEYTRISEPLPTITILGVNEILDCSEEAAKNLQRSRWN
jgi:hypothetical protein